MMKRMICALCAMGVMGQVAFAEGGQPAEVAERIPVVVTIMPQRYFVERLAGDRVEITVMVPPGRDYHAYEPTAQQMRSLTRSRLYFTLGGEFEQVWLPRFQRSAPALRVVATDEGIEKIPVTGQGCGPGCTGHHHGHAQDANDEDPHIWLSPRLVKHQAGIIRDALAGIDPDHAAQYRARYDVFAAELDALDAELRALFEPLPAERPFMVFHPTYGYFARDYGLEQIPIEVQGREPTLRELQEVLARARAEGIRTVFTQPQYSRQTAQRVAQAIGGEVAMTDPMAANWAENLREIGMKIHASLQREE